MDLLTAEQ